MSPRNHLQSGGLYVLLFIRSDPLMKNDFHWALYLHDDYVTGGMKYHIRQPGSGWMADHSLVTDIRKSFLLVGMFQIATVPSTLKDHLDRQMRTYDSSLNTLPGITCRVWVLWVLKLLQQPVNECNILICHNLDELESEIMEWGNEHAVSAAANLQPRPIGASRTVGA